MLQVSHLRCQRGARVLFHDLSFGLQAGQCLWVQGGNGAGKTTLLRIVAGLTRADAGEAIWRGKSLQSQRDSVAQEVIFLGHAAALRGELSALENLRFLCALGGLDLGAKEARVALARWGLGARAHAPARQLSAGQRRRALLARLGLDQRALWLLDEPLAALDTEGAALLSSVLEQHLHSGGAALITSHQTLPLPQAQAQTLQLQ